MPSGISLGAILTSAAGAAASSLFAKSPGKNDAAAPKVEAPTVMPVADGDAAAAAKKKSLVAQIQRRGRASTILTGGETETMGA